MARIRRETRRPAPEIGMQIRPVELNVLSAAECKQDDRIKEDEQSSWSESAKAFLTAASSKGSLMSLIVGMTA
jgi:hypothetical protein